MSIVDLIKLSELQLEGNISTLKSFKESTEDFFTSLEKDKSTIATVRKDIQHFQDATKEANKVLGQEEKTDLKETDSIAYLFKQIKALFYP